VRLERGLLRRHHPRDRLVDRERSELAALVRVRVRVRVWVRVWVWVRVRVRVSVRVRVRVSVRVRVTLRLLSESVEPSTSSLPTTPKTGILSALAILICLPSERPPGSTSARSPAARALATTSLQNGRKSSLTGSSRSCVGASQKGKSPAVLSMSTPKKRSMEPCGLAGWGEEVRVRRLGL